MKIRYYQDNLNRIGILLDSLFNEFQRFKVKHISFHAILKCYTSSYSEEFNGYNDTLLTNFFDSGNKILKLLQYLPKEIEIISIDANPVPFTLHLQIDINSSLIIFYQENKYHIKLSSDNEFDSPEDIKYYLKSF